MYIFLYDSKMLPHKKLPGSFILYLVLPTLTLLHPELIKSEFSNVRIDLTIVMYKIKFLSWYIKLLVDTG